MLPEPSGHPGGAIPELAVAQCLAADLHERPRVAVALDDLPEHRDQGGGPIAVAGDAILSAFYAARVERIAPPRGGLDLHVLIVLDWRAGVNCEWAILGSNQ